MLCSTRVGVVPSLLVLVCVVVCLCLSGVVVCKHNNNRMQPSTDNLMRIISEAQRVPLDGLVGDVPNVRECDITTSNDDAAVLALVQVRGLLSRWLPDVESLFDLEIIPPSLPHSLTANNATTAADVFEVSSLSDGRVVLGGNTGVSLASALAYYFRTYAASDFSWGGNNMNVTAPLPAVPVPVRIVYRVPLRYYQNVCTTSYSFVWWDWERWQTEIDWMAMNGVNAPLASTGQEYVWLKLYESFNITVEQLTNDFFTGPAFLTWNRMGNVEGWGSPLNMDWIIAQHELQMMVLERMRGYGMLPILPAFAGFVPTSFMSLYAANHTFDESSIWNGPGSFPKADTPTYIIDPSDPLFVEVGARFLAIQSEIYNATVNNTNVTLISHLYNADTFNEIDPLNSTLPYLKNAASAVYEGMVTSDPDAVWVMQGWLFMDTAFWNSTRMSAYLSGVPQGGLLVLDLYAEENPVWTTTDQFYGHYWIWCMLHDFGGWTGMFGAVENVVVGFNDAYASTNSSLLGVGLTPEGINQNPVMYELAISLAWNNNTSTAEQANDWFQAYARRRYGFAADTPTNSSSCLMAWEHFRASAYNMSGGYNRGIIVNRPSVPSPVYAGLVELSVFERIRKAHTDTGVGGFGPNGWTFNVTTFAHGAMHLLECASELGENPPVTFSYDLVDSAREMLNMLAVPVQESFYAAYASNDTESAASNGEQLLSVISDLDAVLSTNEFFLLCSWIQDARSAADPNNSTQQDHFESNARFQITLWAQANLNNTLPDYAAKLWSGMLSGFYLPRWKMLVNQVISAMTLHTPFDQATYLTDVLAFESAWTQPTGGDEYVCTPEANAVDVIQSVYAKHATIFQQYLGINTTL